MPANRIRIWLAIVITVLWAVSYVVSVAQGDYTGFQVTTPVMLIAAGAMMASGLRNGHD
jgi:hypothetical protein